MTLVLASSSPRRIGYLKQLGLDFIAVSPDVDESIDEGVGPADAVTGLALLKAETVRANHPTATVIAADTVVAIDGEILGKPADTGEAMAMLGRLQDRTHQVFTGLAIISPEAAPLVDVVETRVRMHRLDREQISRYIATGEPMDKAGAYGIQGHGAALIASIEGCFTSVAGLPVCRLTALLVETGDYEGSAIVCGTGFDAPPPSIAQRLALR